MKHTHTHSGFTLVEMLIVITIFSITTLIVTDMFILTSRSQRRVNESQKLAADTRFILESMARSVHQGTIDYAYYKTLGIDLSNPASVLAVRDTSNNQTVYRRSQNGTGNTIESCKMLASDADQAKCADPSPDPADWQSVNTSDTKITAFSLYIAPQRNPFLLLTDGSGLFEGGNIQPRTTLVVSAENVKATPNSPVHRSYLQTTVTSRVYRR